MFEDALMNYGMAGIFIAYLIFDRQLLLKKITAALERNTDVMRELCIKLKGGR